MYCSLENSESRPCYCINKCCLMYTITLALLAAIFLFLVGLAVGSQFYTIFVNYTAAIIAAAGGVLLMFIVTLLTKCSCKNSLQN